MRCSRSVCDEVGAENHSQIAGGEAARHVHLPEPLLRGDVTLGEEEVVEVGRGDGRNAQRVASHHHRLGESGKLDGAVFLRQRGAHRAVKPDVEGKEDDQQPAPGARSLRETAAWCVEGREGDSTVVVPYESLIIMRRATQVALERASSVLC